MFTPCLVNSLSLFAPHYSNDTVTFGFEAEFTSHHLTMSDPNQTPQRPSAHPPTPYSQPLPVTPLPSSTLLSNFTTPERYAERLSQMNYDAKKTASHSDAQTHTEHKVSTTGLHTISEIDPISESGPDSHEMNTSEADITSEQVNENTQTNTSANPNSNSFEDIQKQFDCYTIEMQNKNDQLQAQLEHMNQLVAQLQYEAAYHRFHANNNNGGYNIAKSISKPESFCGTADVKDDPDTWVAQMRNFLLLSGTPPAIQSQVAATYLKSSAAQWYNTLTPLERGQLTDFEAFASKVLTRFRPLDIVAQARSKLSRLQQTGSVEKFNQQFQQIMSLIPTMNEEERIDAYRRKLKYQLQLQLVTQEYHSLSEIMNVALRTDALMFESQKTFRINKPFNQYKQQDGRHRAESSHSNSTSIPVNNVTVSTNESRNESQQQEVTTSAPLNFIAPRPMNDAERQRCRDNHLCFRCRQPGHVSVNCPVFTSTSGRAPSMKPSVPITKKD